MATPTVRRLQLGNELRRLRELAGHTPAAAAQLLGCNATKISRLELGHSGITLGDVKLLLESYGDDPEHIAWMMELARNNRERGRWSGYRSAIPDWFRVYVDLERDADSIRATRAELVPGLLQTEAYMRALLDGATGAPADIDAAVRNRTERQHVLAGDDGPRVSFVLSESCVRRVVGSREVMAEQLEHLVAMAAHPRVQIQLQPFDSIEARSGAGFSFSLLRVPAVGAASPLVFVYCEDFDDARYLDDHDTVSDYEALWSGAQAGAMGPRASADMLHAIAQEYT